MSSDIEERLQARQNLKALAKRARRTAPAPRRRPPQPTPRRRRRSTRRSRPTRGLAGPGGRPRQGLQGGGRGNEAREVAEASFLSLYRQLRDEQLGEPGALLRSVGQLGGTVLQGKESLRRAAESSEAQEARAEELLERLSGLGLGHANAVGYDKGSSSQSAVAALEGVLSEERKAIRAEADGEAARRWEAERVSLTRQLQEKAERSLAEGERRIEALEGQLSLAAAESRGGVRGSGGDGGARGGRGARQAGAPGGGGGARLAGGASRHSG